MEDSSNVPTEVASRRADNMKIYIEGDYSRKEVKVMSQRLETYLDAAISERESS